MFRCAFCSTNLAGHLAVVAVHFPKTNGMAQAAVFVPCESNPHDSINFPAAVEMAEIRSASCGMYVGFAEKQIAARKSGKFPEVIGFRIRPRIVLGPRLRWIAMQSALKSKSFAFWVSAGIGPKAAVLIPARNCLVSLFARVPLKSTVTMNICSSSDRIVAR